MGHSESAIAQGCRPPAALPEFLKALKGWLVWRLTQVPGESKPRKVPHYVNGSPRKNHGTDEDRAQLSTYDRAVAACQRGGYSGIGLAILGDMGVVALDFDDVVVDGVIDPRIVAYCEGTYSEISPSGTGVRAFLRGTLPSRKDNDDKHGAKKKADPEWFGVEFFGTSGFVTVTGNVTPECDLFGYTEHVEPLTAVVRELFNERFGAAFLPATTGDDDDGDWLLTVQPKIGMSLDDARRVLASVSPACGYEDWMLTGGALHHEFDGSDAALDLFDEWSQGKLATNLNPKDIDYSGRKSVETKWRSFGRYTGQVRTMAWVLKVAKENRTAEHVIAELRRRPASEVLTAYVEEIKHLDAAGKDAVRKEVAKLTGQGVNTLKALERERRTADARKRREDATRERVGDRVEIEHRPEDSTEQAYTVERLIIDNEPSGRYVQFADVPAEIVTKAPPYAHLVDDPDAAPPAVPQIASIDEVGMRGRIERVVVFTETTDKGPRAIGVPLQIVKNLLGLPSNASRVTGLVPHPLVLRDGTILADGGLHEVSGLFLTGAAIDDVRPYSEAEARTALQRLAASFLDGFEFASALDRDIALAFLLTGVERPGLDVAPGFAILANVQSSGKTTLARRLHVILTGHDMPASTLPKTDDEMRKQLHSVLMRGPAMVCFDNVPDGYTVRSPDLAAAMTSSSYTQRVLGASRDIEVPTNTLFVLTGNNLSFGEDEITRFMVCRLQPTSADPARRTFKQPDVLRHALGVRVGVLRDVVGIVSGFHVSGARGNTASRFPAWDRMVRQPLMWAGAGDIAQVFATNAATSEGAQALRVLLLVLRELFGANRFTASDVVTATRGVSLAAGSPFLEGVSLVGTLPARLRDALEMLGCRDCGSARSVTWVLKAKAGRVCEVEGNALKLVGPTEDRKGFATFQVVGE